jgi:hypothetical protein
VFEVIFLAFHSEKPIPIRVPPYVQPHENLAQRDCIGADKPFSFTAERKPFSEPPVGNGVQQVR